MNAVFGLVGGGKKNIYFINVLFQITFRSHCPYEQFKLCLIKKLQIDRHGKNPGPGILLVVFNDTAIYSGKVLRGSTTVSIFQQVKSSALM